MNRNLVLIVIIALLIIVMIRYGSTGSQGKLLFEEQDSPYSLNEEQVKWLSAIDQIVIGVPDDTLPLLTWDSAGRAEGLLVDYMGLISEGYGLNVVYEGIPLRDIHPGLTEGRVDAVICAYDRHLEQGLKVTMPMMKNKGILLIDQGFDLKEVSRGTGLKIEVVEGSAAVEGLKKQLPEAELFLSPTMAEAAQNLMNGRGNAIAGSDTAIYHCVDRAYLEGHLKQVPGYIYERNYVLAVAEENEFLYEILNNAIYHMEGETPTPQLQGKWTGISYALKSEGKFEEVGILILIIFTAVLCVFALFYQSNKSLYEELGQRMDLLIESQNEMQTTFDGVTYFLAEVNLQGDIVGINRALAQYLEIKRHMAIGSPLLSLMRMDRGEGERLSKLIEETFLEEAEKQIELFIGRKIFDVHSFLIKDKKDKIQKILLMMADVTDARSAERQMIQDNKMIAVGQLAAGVAHEIRNPLGIIRNYCYILKELDYTDFLTRDEAIEIIEKSVNKSSKIIENLLNFSRLSANKTELVDMNAHIKAILDLQKNMLTRRNIRMIYWYRGEEKARINIEALEIVLVNLISNAADAIKDTGEIRVSCMEKDQVLDVEVWDSGEGIEPEIMEAIFNPFFSTKSKMEGNGLGLYIVYNEVQKMGGEIKVDSKPGAYTRFHLRIPVAKEEEKDA